MSTSRTSCCPASSPMWYVYLTIHYLHHQAHTMLLRRMMAEILDQEKLNESIVVMNKALQVRSSPNREVRGVDCELMEKPWCRKSTSKT